jgi:hypothetical protein
MSYRNAQLWVQHRTLSRLRSAVKLYPRAGGTNELGMLTSNETADERADRLLNEAIERDYPDVVQMEKEIRQIEANYMKKGKVKNEPTSS